MRHGAPVLESLPQVAHTSSRRRDWAEPEAGAAQRWVFEDLGSRIAGKKAPGWFTFSGAACLWTTLHPDIAVAASEAPIRRSCQLSDDANGLVLWITLSVFSLARSDVIVERGKQLLCYK